VLGIASCRQQAASSNRQEVSAADAATVDSLVAGIDSLKTLAEALKPGLGEFMLQLKYHHDRLGEAITAKDYERAQYEIDEMKETAEKIIHLNITNDKPRNHLRAFTKNTCNRRSRYWPMSPPKRTGPLCG